MTTFFAQYHITLQQQFSPFITTTIIESQLCNNKMIEEHMLQVHHKKRRINLEKNVGGANRKKMYWNVNTKTDELLFIDYITPTTIRMWQTTIVKEGGKLGQVHSQRSHIFSIRVKLIFFPPPQTKIDRSPLNHRKHWKYRIFAHVCVCWSVVRGEMSLNIVQQNTLAHIRLLFFN